MNVGKKTWGQSKAQQGAWAGGRIVVISRQEQKKLEKGVVDSTIDKTKKSSPLQREVKKPKQ